MNRNLLLCVLMAFVLFLSADSLASPKKPLVVSCSEENDLYRVLRRNGVAVTRRGNPLEAVSTASRGGGGYDSRRGVS